MSKKRKMIITLCSVCFVILAAICILSILNRPRIMAAVITGAGSDSANDTHTILIGLGGQIEIPCTQKQFSEVLSDSYSFARDTIPLAVYEAAFLSKEPKRILEVISFQDTAYSHLDIDSAPNEVYYRLINEDFVTTTKDYGVFFRIYKCFEPMRDRGKLDAQLIITPYFDNINSAKEWIKKKDKNNLQLWPRTIVEKDVIDKWDSEGYSADFEYTDASPKGLSFEKLQFKKKKLLGNPFMDSLSFHCAIFS